MVPQRSRQTKRWRRGGASSPQLKPRQKPYRGFPPDLVIVLPNHERTSSVLIFRRRFRYLSRVLPPRVVPFRLPTWPPCLAEQSPSRHRHRTTPQGSISNADPEGSRIDRLSEQEALYYAAAVSLYPLIRTVPEGLISAPPAPPPPLWCAPVVTPR